MVSFPFISDFKTPTDSNVEKNERFRSFNTIKIASEGQRTTHLSYAKQLMTVYRLTNDNMILVNAQRLHDYIEKTSLSK